MTFITFYFMGRQMAKRAFLWAWHRGTIISKSLDVVIIMALFRENY